MSLYYFDSSAFAKLFIAEEGSDSLARLVDSIDPKERIISKLVGLEVRSALRRRQYQGDITPADATIALASLKQELSREVEQPITVTVIEIASTLIDRHRLRTLDSLQLATALVAQSTLRDRPFYFVASDRLLLSAAKAEGFEVWDPADE